MAYALEYHFDPATDVAVRRLWSVLEANGIPTPAREVGRPHLSLARCDADDPARLAEALSRFARAAAAFHIEFGALGVFAPEGWVFLAPVATAQLIERHARVHQWLDGLAAAAGVAAVDRDSYAPGRWVPDGRVIWAELVWLCADGATEFAPVGASLDTGALPLSPELAAHHPRLVLGVRSNAGEEGYYALGVSVPGGEGASSGAAAPTGERALGIVFACSWVSTRRAWRGPAPGPMVSRSRGPVVRPCGRSQTRWPRNSSASSMRTWGRSPSGSRRRPAAAPREGLVELSPSVSRKVAMPSLSSRRVMGGAALTLALVLAACGPVRDGAAGAAPLVYVANAGDGTVSRLDPAPGRGVGRAIPAGPAPAQVAVGSDGRLLVLSPVQDHARRLFPQWHSSQLWPPPLTRT